MKPKPEFQSQPKSFWAYIRLISQQVGYTQKGLIKVPTLSEIALALKTLHLDPSKIVRDDGMHTELGAALLAYLSYRAQVLNDSVQHQLMDAAAAQKVFKQLQVECRHDCPIPMNKQTGPKAKPAYFTGIVNMLIVEAIKGAQCDFSPLALTTVIRDGAVLRTLARRIDGAFPSILNPLAVWEIKEYYYTTTFGSRIADGVYETQLDGMELQELRQTESIEIKHYLMVDAYETWWEKGKSYLCRIVDMLNMGYVDEVLFGKEVLTQLPKLAKQWVRALRQKDQGS